jgi:hypothetical protein
MSAWYAQLNIAFDMTGGINHHKNDFNIIQQGASTCQGKEECIETFVIICTENNRYHMATNKIGYDTSAPNINVHAEPNPTREPMNLQSTIYLTSDDEVWCRYERMDNSVTYSFIQETPDPINQYATEQSVFLGYLSPPEAGTESYNIDYSITCINFAGREAQDQVTITVAPTNNVGITINNEQTYDTRSVTLDVTTDLPASCSYTFNPLQPSRPFSKTQGTSHTQSHSFTLDGTHNLIVNCQALSGPYSASATHTMTVDSTGPKMLEIIAQTATCSLTELTATFISNATVIGLKSYSYSITDAQGKIIKGWTNISATGTKEVTETLTLIKGNYYNWQVRAKDNFNRESSIISKRVQAQDETYITCDFKNPEASITIEPIYGGVEATTNCKDDGSGCSKTFDFLHAPITCNGTYKSTYYTSNPLILKTSGIACAKVYDNAALMDQTSESFTLISHCSNGIQDADEDGRDCGGECPANCETCSNGKQDTDEDGIDCGGICAKSCSEFCGNKKLDSGEECDGTNTISITCKELGFASGTVTCDSNCDFHTGKCVPFYTAKCGNNILEPGEKCDGTTSTTCSSLGLGTGTVTCDDKCELVTTGCSYPPPKPYCGNKIVDSGEDCDGGTNLSCSDLNLGTGSLSCSSSCKFRTTSCSYPEGPGVCGDKKLNPPEVCDGSIGTTRCTTLGFSGGTLSCSANNCTFITNACTSPSTPLGYCGDGFITKGELCDGSNINATCAKLGFAGGSIKCTSKTCNYDTTACLPKLCGNAKVDTGEQCDGGVGKLTCEDHGMKSGTLRCSSDCKISTKDCIGTATVCGDGFIGPGETCDEGFQGQTCEDYNLISGTLGCIDCNISTDNCFNGYCGDNEIDQGESCDGLTWGEVYYCKDLSSQFVSGIPVCGLDCHFNTEECVPAVIPPESKLCLSDNDCKFGQKCEDNACVSKSNINITDTLEDTDLDGLPDDWEIDYFDNLDEDSVSDSDGDGYSNYDEYYAGTDPTDPEDKPVAPKSENHTLGLIFLIIGLVFMLAGGGYIVYVRYINPPPKPTYNYPTGQNSAVNLSEPKESPEVKAARLAAEKKKLELQEKARNKAKEAKEQERKKLLSSFTKEKPQEENNKNEITKTKTNSVQTKTLAEKKIPDSKSTLSTQEHEDTFSDLEKLAHDEIDETLTKKTTNEIFKDLAELSGSSKNKIKVAINNNDVTSDDIVALFENAEKKQLTPKKLTPIFKHLISKGKLDHDVVHDTIHELHNQEKLTQQQKEKILKDLEEIGKGQ